jgi:hypothetical protein
MGRTHRHGTEWGGSEETSASPRLRDDPLGSYRSGGAVSQMMGGLSRANNMLKPPWRARARTCSAFCERLAPAESPWAPAESPRAPAEMLARITRIRGIALEPTSSRNGDFGRGVAKTPGSHRRRAPRSRLCFALALDESALAAQPASGLLAAGTAGGETPNLGGVDGRLGRRGGCAFVLEALWTRDAFGMRECGVTRRRQRSPSSDPPGLESGAI